MQEYQVPGHEPSYLPQGNWRLVWADEFDGTELDTTKWGFRTTFWGKPFDAYTTEGVVLDGNSHLELHRVERNGCYASPQLQTGANTFDAPERPEDTESKYYTFRRTGIMEEPKFAHRFGYYECRCKFQKDPETMWSAFWMQCPNIGTRMEPEWGGIEHDIMECFKPGEGTTGNIVYQNTTQDRGRVYYPLDDTPDGWHYFGMDWQPDGYVFYYNGREISRDNSNVSQVPEFLLLTTEVKGYRIKGEEGENLRKIKGEFQDDAFIVDFVRVFDKVE